MTDLVTVIVPVYNTEKYIKKCVDSILGQTYTELEVILVDDGSTDSCPRICDSYAERDSRVRVIHKENGGLSDARNAALDIVSGSYVTFVDGDDYIEKNYVEYLYSLIKKYGADMSICSYKSVDADGKPVGSPAKCGKEFVMDRKQAFFELLSRKYFSNSACFRLFKTEHFRDIRFPKGRIFEDVATVYKTMFLCDKVAFGGEALYYYLFRRGSISRNEYTPAREDAVIFGEQMARDITEMYPELRKIADCRCFDSYVTFLKDVDREGYPDKWTEAWEKLKSKRKTVLTYGSSGIKRKVIALASYFGKII